MRAIREAVLVAVVVGVASTCSACGGQSSGTIASYANGMQDAVEYPLINSSLILAQPDQGDLTEAEAVAVAVTKANFPIQDIQPTAKFGVFTDHNEEVNITEGGVPYGLVNRLVWAVSYDGVPVSEIPHGSGPVRGDSTGDVSAAPPAVDSGYQILYIVDAHDGMLLEIEIMPEDPSVMLGIDPGPKPKS